MSPPAALECPAEETLLAFARGQVEEVERASVIEHLDACVVCREAVVAAAREGEPATVATAGAPRIGRYEIVRPIGAGAMGIVFEARDPELDRSVALKLLRRQLGDSEDRRLEHRLLGEARALAKLAHPNVVAAFEIARHDGELYLVMELVEGPTVTGWLAAAPRAVADVLALFVQAGRGLAAAHAAGIVHRDFKLDNVLVGPDGRARVTDFGLASGTLSGPTPDLRGDAIVLTMTGALAGTPAFMAPEVLRGDGASEASDQFAFAVSLWIALYGVRPFRGESVDELVRDIERGEPRAPIGRRLPPRLREVVVRGLAADPAQRWPSLPALLGELERVTRRRRPWIVAASITGVLAIAGGTAGFALAMRPSDGPTCSVASGAATALWSPEVATRLGSAMQAVIPARATQVTVAVGEVITAWRERWLLERGAACRLGGDAGATRATCLDLQLRQATAVVRLLSEADAAIAEGAIDAARRLPDPGACIRAGRAPSRDDAPAARALDERLADARGLHRVGRFPAARDAAASVLSDAEAAGFEGVRLRALLLLAESQSDSGQRSDALATFARVMSLAVAQHDDHALAEALVHLVSVYAAGGELPAHDLAESLATAALARAGDDPDLAAMLAQGRCRAGWNRPEEYERGVRNCEVAAQTWRTLHGADAPELAWVENQRGLLAHAAHRYDDALLHFQRFEALSLRSHGPEYVNIDVARVNAAAALVELGRHAEAEPILRDLVSRRDWGSAWNGLGQVLLVRGSFDEAITAYENAAAAGVKFGFTEDRCHGLIGVAEVQATRGQRDAATAALIEASNVCTRHAVADADALIAKVRDRLAR